MKKVLLLSYSGKVARLPQTQVNVPAGRRDHIIIGCSGINGYRGKISDETSVGMGVNSI